MQILLYFASVRDASSKNVNLCPSYLGKNLAVWFGISPEICLQVSFNLVNLYMRTIHDIYFLFLSYPP